MKNLINKVLLVLLVLFVGISLTACGEETDTTNKNVPYGTLSSETVYASIGDIKLSEKALYDELRVNGFDYLFDEIINTLVKPSDFGLSVDNNREELIELVNKACYGTSDEEALAKMNSTTKATYVKKYVDSMYLQNINITATNIYTEECLGHYLNQLAQKAYAEKVLTDENSKYFYANEFQKENGEFVLDEDGKQIKNTYYISEESIEASYNATQDSEAEYNVVIVAFNTLADAKKALNGYNENELTYENFKTIYNNKYGYKTVSEDNFFLTTTELGAYDSGLSTLVKNMKAGDYKLYQQFGKNVYLVYLNQEKPEVEYEKLEEADKAAAKEETIKELIEGKLTSNVISTLLVEKVYDTEIVIYDYVFDALYAAENSDHKRLEASEWKDEYNSYVAKVGETYITVADFYSKLEKLLGLTTSLDYFTNEVLLNSKYADKLTDKDLETIDNEYKTAVESFEKDSYASSGLPASVGKDVFLFAYFGSTNETEIKNQYKSQKIWEYYLKEKPENYFALAEAFSKQYHDKYFDLSVKHILLTADFDSDGTPDDPELFMNKLSAEKQTAFTNAIVTAMDAIVKEVNYIVEKDYSSLVDALDYVLREFYANGTLLSDTTKTWSFYKDEFNLGLTIEDLSSVSSSTYSQYVKEFGIGVQKLYAQLSEEKKLDDDYLASSVSNIDELIKTNYGYHILGVYNSGNVTSALYTKDNDSSEQYVNIKVEVNGEKVTIENAYSENKWASINQIRIYDAQVNTEDGITDLPSAVKTYISKFYTTFTSRFNNESFRNILLAKTELTIDFADANNDAKFAEFIEIQKRQLDSYEDYSSESINFLAGWWELVDQYIVNYTPAE
jgi:hypothetical protein